jgi:hypothetical protein
LMNNAAARGTLENELLWREVQRNHKRGRLGFCWTPRKSFLCHLQSILTGCKLTMVVLKSFVRSVDWRSSTKGMSQIWLQIREEMRNFLESYYGLATSRNLLAKSGDFRILFLKMWRLWHFVWNPSPTPKPPKTHTIVVPCLRHISYYWNTMWN